MSDLPQSLDNAQIVRSAEAMAILNSRREDLRARLAVLSGRQDDGVAEGLVELLVNWAKIGSFVFTTMAQFDPNYGLVGAVLGFTNLLGGTNCQAEVLALAVLSAQMLDDQEDRIETLERAGSPDAQRRRFAALLEDARWEERRTVQGAIANTILNSATLDISSLRKDFLVSILATLGQSEILYLAGCVSTTYNRLSGSIKAYEKFMQHSRPSMIFHTNCLQRLLPRADWV